MTKKRIENLSFKYIKEKNLKFKNCIENKCERLEMFGKKVTRFLYFLPPLSSTYFLPLYSECKIKLTKIPREVEKCKCRQRFYLNSQFFMKNRTNQKLLS